MQYLLTPYVSSVHPYAWWDNVFTDSELDWLQNEATNATQSAEVGGDLERTMENRDVRRSKVKWINHKPETSWIFSKLSHVVSSMNANYFKFDLTGFGESIQLANYDHSENGTYGWHIDMNDGSSKAGPSRKLSVVLQLTDPSAYEGGNLQIKIGPNIETINKRRGLIVAFASYQIHQVTPVTQGSRQSLVCWISGPPFK